MLLPLPVSVAVLEGDNDGVPVSEGVRVVDSVPLDVTVARALRVPDCVAVDAGLCVGVAERVGR